MRLLRIVLLAVAFNGAFYVFTTAIGGPPPSLLAVAAISTAVGVVLALHGSTAADPAPSMRHPIEPR